MAFFQYLVFDGENLPSATAICGETTISAATLFTAAFTIPLLFSMPSARPLIKSGIQLSKSVRGPSSGTEKCRWERIVLATSVTALATAPIQLRIPFTMPLMISAPYRHPADARLVI